MCGLSTVEAKSGCEIRTSGPVPSVPLIVTAAPEYDSLAALHEGERFPQGAELTLLRNGRIEPLVPQLAESADASVSFDGKTVLFAGKKNAGDPWQIWQMALDGGQPQLVLTARTDLIRPMWMPAGRMVYARRAPTGFVLETAALDGSRRLKLSYVAGNFIPDDVLRDGRVLFESAFPLGVGTKPELYTVYADGSGEEAVRCDHQHAQRAGSREHGRQMPTGTSSLSKPDTWSGLPPRWPAKLPSPRRRRLRWRRDGVAGRALAAGRPPTR